MQELTANDIMTLKVVTIKNNASIGELSDLLLKNKISGVPVVDEEGKLVGLVTEADIIAREANFHFPLSFGFSLLKNIDSYTRSTKHYLNTKVEEIMTRHVETAREDTLVSEVASIMINNNINRVPVLSKDNKLIGIIARADIMKSMIKEGKNNKK